ncbi:MAG: DUF222 domain-containing protein [Ilumatobacteraceae bacterium]
MFRSGVVGEVEHLVNHDPAVCDRTELTALVTVTNRVRGWLDALDVRIALRASDLAAQGSCAAAADVLTGGGRRSCRDADSAARRATVCDQLPYLHDALAAGTVSAGHVDLIARTASTLSAAGRAQLADLEPAIVASAAASSVEEFGREMTRLGRIFSRDDGEHTHDANRTARRVRRWVDRITGMCHTHLELDAETDAHVAAALDAALAAARAKPQDPDLTFDQLQADALDDLITRPPGKSNDGGDARVPDVTVLIDLETLRHGLHDHSVAESGDANPLPPTTIRRMCCEATIIPIVLNGDGVVVDQGRARRVATREQRRALRAMYCTCAYPNCPVRFDDCQIHHVEPWDLGGATDLPNLLPLCTRHHHLVHEGRWTLTLQPDRTITLCRPDGSVHFRGLTVDRAPTGVAADRPSGVPPDPPPGDEHQPPADVDRPLPRWTPAANSQIPGHVLRAAIRAEAERAAASAASDGPPPVAADDNDLKARLRGAVELATQRPLTFHHHHHQTRRAGVADDAARPPARDGFGADEAASARQRRRPPPRAPAA